MRRLVSSLGAAGGPGSPNVCAGQFGRLLAAFALNLVVLAATPAAAVLADDTIFIYVSPQGNDHWSGRQAGTDDSGGGPFATLTAARNEIRKLKAKEPNLPPIIVRIAAGLYRLTAPVVFEPQDSGTVESPVRYEAASAEPTVFSGGRELAPFQVGEDGLWRTEIPEVAAGRWYFEQLWVNEQRATRARTPNEFFQYMRNVVDEPVTDADPKAKPRVRRTIFVDPADIQSLANLKPEEMRDAQLVGFRVDTTRCFLSAVDASAGAVTTIAPVSNPWNALGRNTGYWLENYRAALDSPGEWLLERTGKLLYKPRENESPATTRAVAPVIDTLLVLRGDPSKDHWVEEISFHGLTFAHSQQVTPEMGLPPKGWMPNKALVIADGARNVAFEQCRIGHTGRFGLWLRRGCVRNRVEQCDFFDLGAGGVAIGDESVPKTPSDRTEHNVVDNNIIHGCGRWLPSSVGLWIGPSGANQVTHNEICDGYYSGIGAAFNWGTAENQASGNKIDFNHIHHLGGGYLDNLAGIHTFGRSAGASFSNNVIHDIYAGRVRAWGIRDEGDSGDSIVENNLVYRITSGGYYLDRGKGSIVRNNIFALGDKLQLQHNRDDNDPSLIFENNIIYYNSGELFSYNGKWKAPSVKSSRNLYFDASGRPVDFIGQNLAERQAGGQDVGSWTIDPRFAAPERGDFRLLPDSPATQKINFKEFDYSLAGVYGDEAWRDLAALEKNLSFKTPPEPRPVPVHDSFEATAVGSPPAIAEVTVSGEGDSIAVTNEMAAAGRRSLKIIDAPGLKQPQMPTLFYYSTHDSGTVRVAFDLRLEEDAALEIWWRDSGQPVLTGPRLVVVDGRMVSDGRQPLLEIPEGEWMHVEMICGVGPEWSGVWRLVVKLPEEPPRTFSNLKCRDPAWRTFDRVDFNSIAKDRTIAYLDNLEVTGTAGGGEPVRAALSQKND